MSLYIFWFRGPLVEKSPSCLVCEPLAGIEPVQSGVTMAVSSTGFQLATCSESGEREGERDQLSQLSALRR